jgi:hypothetical protein
MVCALNVTVASHVMLKRREVTQFRVAMHATLAPGGSGLHGTVVRARVP